MPMLSSTSSSLLCMRWLNCMKQHRMPAAKSSGGAGCWLELRCPKCGKRKSTERRPEDYPEAVRMEIICPKCDDGDFHEPFYYDASGRHITRDPNTDRKSTRLN